LSKCDDEIIAKYLNGEEAQIMREIAEGLGGIDRVEDDCFIMADGTPVDIQSKSMFERWAEEEKSRPADWLQCGEDADKFDCVITQMENPKRIQLDHGRGLGYNKDHVDIIRAGFIPKTKEDKWYIYSEDNWLFFHRSWNGQGIYKAEIKNINGRYIIDDFYAERNSKIYSNIDDAFDYHILRVLIEWGLLCCDCRNMCLTFYNKTEADTAKLWDILGNFFISSEEIERYELAKVTKQPCNEVFKKFNIKVETFFAFFENLQHHKIIPIDEFQEVFVEFNNLALKMETTTAEILSLIEKEKNIDKILEYISRNYSSIFLNVDEIQKTRLKYFKNDKRSFFFEGLVSDIENSTNPIKLTKETIEKMLSYKKIINDKLFGNYKMFRVDIGNVTGYYSLSPRI
jgi:hypothetical protein